MSKEKGNSKCEGCGKEGVYVYQHEVEGPPSVPGDQLPHTMQPSKPLIRWHCYDCRTKGVA